jgi:hypothetical protein
VAVNVITNTCTLWKIQTLWQIAVFVFVNNMLLLHAEFFPFVFVESFGGFGAKSR